MSPTVWIASGHYELIWKLPAKPEKHKAKEMERNEKKEIKRKRMVITWGDGNVN